MRIQPNVRVLARCAAVFALLSAADARAAPPDLEAAAADARALLAELVAADTSSPPGNEARATAIGAARLRAAGLEPEEIEFAPGRANLVVRLKGDGSAPPLLITGHVDVVGADGQAWSTPPHALTEKDGWLQARGVTDCLGLAAVELEAFLLLHRAGVPLRRDVILAWVGDEESGGKGMRYLLERRPETIRAGLALNEGGGAVLQPDGKPKYYSLQLAEKRYQDFQLRARGPTGHSAAPKPGNPIARLARALERITASPFPPRLLPVTRAWLAANAEREAPAVGRAMRALATARVPPPEAVAMLDGIPHLAPAIRTTCVPTLVAGGTRENALPGEATANVNCRILPGERVEEVRARLQRLVGDPALEIATPQDSLEADASPLDGEGPDAIRRVAPRFWPGAPVVPEMSFGTTDSRFLRAAGIPSYGIDVFALTEDDLYRAHGVDERIPAAGLRPAVQFMYELLLDLAARPPAAPPAAPP